ncbi:hypothetical protein CHARACLAT_011999 [Characodon lateralis]|uniref:Uncharacterized protein n=1 Tax=Characodon lateralis TaxID=208331 RepID=A0ABU7D8V1_9TELE|nr:hypothetical protein [Characodon lateralis]
MSTQREPMHARGQHVNSMQRDPLLGVTPRTFLLQGNHATNCHTIERHQSNFFIRSFIPFMCSPTLVTYLIFSFVLKGHLTVDLAVTQYDRLTMITFDDFP